MAQNNPVRIDHDHIVDSVVEIRFVARNEETVFLDMLSILKDSLPNYKFVPANIPQEIRSSQPQLKFAVEGTLIGEHFSIGIGLSAIVFNCQNGYKTWKEFSPFIVSSLERVKEHIDKVTRIGVRFTNFFDDLNDLSKFNVDFRAGNKQRVIGPKDVNQMILRFSTVGESISYNVTVANLTSVTVANQAIAAKFKKNTGTTLDIDAYIDKKVPKDIGKEFYDCIEFVHSKEKDMFFSLLEESFLIGLNPVY